MAQAESEKSKRTEMEQIELQSLKSDAIDRNYDNVTKQVRSRG